MTKAIIYDSREQKHGHYTHILKQRGYALEKRKMEQGDISFILNGVDYSDQFSIERKANWNELYGNLIGKDHARIKREFTRLLKVPYVVLLIEEEKGIDGIDFMKRHSYKMSISRFKTTYFTFVRLRQRERARAKIPLIQIVYCKKTDTAGVIIKLINDFLKNR